MHHESNPKPASDASLEDIFGPAIFCYTRAQAIADGVLVDVTPTAYEAGFKWPVALTHAVWEDCVAWSGEDSTKQSYQDQSGRLWDVLFMAYVAIRTRPQAGSVIHYALHRVPRDGVSTQAQRTELKIVLSGGDDGEPVLTIMQPHED